MLNHFEIRMNQQRLELWGSDHMKEDFRLMTVVDNMDLNFTRGFIHFQQAHYDSFKAENCLGCVSSHQTYHWDNIGFDGPVVPTPKRYAIPDALARSLDGSRMNLGYLLGPNRVSRADVQRCRRR